MVAKNEATNKPHADHDPARDHARQQVGQRVHPHQRQRRKHADGTPRKENSSPSATDKGAATSQRFVWGIVVLRGRI